MSEVLISLPGGLESRAGLDEVEATLLHLALGIRVDPAGSMVREHLASGGKRMRARLALAATEALGLERREAVAWAAACEMVHNATLVHDDIEDGDRVRRDRPTMWAKHGVGPAINAGDLMLMLPFVALQQVDRDDATRWQLASAIARHAERTARSQALELDLLRDRRLDPESWTEAAEGKSGPLLALPVEGAAILAGLAPRTAKRLGQAFCRIGTLYQLHDDVLDCFGDKGRGGVGNDLREGKVSALVVEHLRLHPEDTGSLVALLETPREATSEAEVHRTIARFRDGGALAAVRARIAAAEREIETSAVLAAVPDVHDLARALVAAMRRTH